PDNCDDHAVKVEAGDAGRTEEIEQKTTHQGADDPQRDVEPKTLALLVDNFASDKPSNQTKYDPTDDPHVAPPAKSVIPHKSKADLTRDRSHTCELPNVQSWGAPKVSQLATEPSVRPVVNQRLRCAALPWVKE